MGTLQQAGALQTLLAHADKSRRDKALREGLAASGGDVEKALAVALQSGDVTAAHELAPLVKLAQERRLGEQFSGAMTGGGGSPEQLDAMAARLAASGHPGAASVSALADKRRQAAEAAATLKTMQSAPAQTIQPDPQENQQAADQGTPAVAPATVPGKAGVFATLMESDIPQIAQAAKNYQAQLDSAKSIKPEFWVSIQKGLQDKETALLNRREPAAKSSDESPTVTSDTLEMDAYRYLTDGTLPPNMGRGQQGADQATKIRNRAAQLAKEVGMSPDEIRFAQLTNKAQVSAIMQLGKARAQILQFEKTANMNADLALQASEKVDRTGVPVINRWIQAGRTAIGGDVEASKFHAATETFVSEYAKVMSGGYGAAATTEGAQNRAHGLLNEAHTKDQFRGVVGQLKAEMENRVKALNGQMEEEKGRLRGAVRKPTGDAPPTPAATPVASPSAPASFQDGQTATGPNGEKIVFRGGKWQTLTSQ